MVLAATGFFMQASIESDVGLLRDQVRQLEREVEHLRGLVSSPFLSRDEAAAFLRIDTRTLDRLVARGQVQARRVGARVLLARKELLECLR